MTLRRGRGAGSFALRRGAIKAFQVLLLSIALAMAALGFPVPVRVTNHLRGVRIEAIQERDEPETRLPATA